MKERRPGRAPAGMLKEGRRGTAPAGTLKEKRSATLSTESDTDLPKIPKVMSDVMNALSALEKVSKHLAENEMKDAVKDLKGVNVDIYRATNDLQVLASTQLLQNSIPKGMLKERRPGIAPPAGMLKEKRTAGPAPAPRPSQVAKPVPVGKQNVETRAEGEKRGAIVAARGKKQNGKAKQDAKKDAKDQKVNGKRGKKEAKRGAKATKGKRKGKNYGKNGPNGKKLKKDVNGKKKTGKTGRKGKKANKSKRKGKTAEVKKMMKNLHHTDPRPIHGEGEPHAEARLLLVRTLESVGSAKPVIFLGFIDRGRELVDEAVKHLRAAKMSLEHEIANPASKPTGNDDEAEDEEGPTAQAAKPAWSQPEADANEDDAAIPGEKSVAESSVDSSEEVDASEVKGPAAAKIKVKTDATKNADAIPAADAREKGANEDQGMTASKAEKEDATKDKAPRPAAKPVTEHAAKAAATANNNADQGARADPSKTLSAGEGITG